MSDVDPGSSGKLDEPEDDSGPDPLIGSVIAGRYRIDERLGVGGMGAVYRAEHVLMRKAVAVKVLHREMTVLDEVVKRFEREAIAAGRIDHPNVTVATDFGKLEDGAFYLVLEYVQGRSLGKALEEDGAFDVPRGLFVARQVAAALGAAHAAEIVHRDLKPDNVMLIERGGTKDFVKVLDFGIAKVSAEAGASKLTRVGAVFGTPAYMAPEQAAGQHVDGRADLYSLGLVLYEMLAGKPAFVAEELVQLLTKQLTEPPPPLPDSVDAETRALVERLVEKDPALRVQSASELVTILDARLGAMGVTPPDSTLLGAPSMRRPAPASAPSFVEATARTEVLVPARTAPSLASLASFGTRAREFAREFAARVIGGDTIHVAGRKVPMWLLGAAGFAVLVAIVIGLGFIGGSGPPPAPGAPASVRPPEPELAPIIARATEGDRAALAALEARREERRAMAEWAALITGRSKLLEHTAALTVLERALPRAPELANDPGVLGAVRRAADDDAARARAFELASGPLGAGGVDVLFDVWASTLEKTDMTVKAKALLDREDVRAHASPALRVALDLRRTKRCDEVKPLLPLARERADERAFRPLNQLNSRSGCGFLGLADCYGCLRKGDALAEAIKAAQQRKGPRFQ